MAHSSVHFQPIDGIAGILGMFVLSTTSWVFMAHLEPKMAAPGTNIMIAVVWRAQMEPRMAHLEPKMAHLRPKMAHLGPKMANLTTKMGTRFQLE